MGVNTAHVDCLNIETQVENNAVELNMHCTTTRLTCTLYLKLRFRWVSEHFAMMAWKYQGGSESRGWNTQAMSPIIHPERLLVTQVARYSSAAAVAGRRSIRMCFLCQVGHVFTCAGWAECLLACSMRGNDNFEVSICFTVQDGGMRFFMLLFQQAHQMHAVSCWRYELHWVPLCTGFQEFWTCMVILNKPYLFVLLKECFLNGFDGNNLNSVHLGSVQELNLLQ